MYVTVDEDSGKDGPAPAKKRKSVDGGVVADPPRLQRKRREAKVAPKTRPAVVAKNKTRKTVSVHSESELKHRQHKSIWQSTRPGYKARNQGLRSGRISASKRFTSS